MLARRPDIQPEMLWKAVIDLERPEGFEPPTRCFEDRSSPRPTMAIHVHEGVFQSLRKRQPILWTPMVVDLCPPPWLQFGYSPGGYLCRSKEGIKLPRRLAPHRHVLQSMRKAMQPEGLSAIFKRLDVTRQDAAEADSWRDAHHCGHVLTQQRVPLAVDLDLGFAVDRGVQWDLHANRRACMYPHFGPIQLQDKFRVTVGDQRRLVEPRGGVDHGEHPQPSRHPVEVGRASCRERV